MTPMQPDRPMSYYSKKIWRPSILVTTVTNDIDIQYSDNDIGQYDLCLSMSINTMTVIDVWLRLLFRQSIDDIDININRNNLIYQW